VVFLTLDFKTVHKGDYVKMQPARQFSVLRGVHTLVEVANFYGELVTHMSLTSALYTLLRMTKVVHRPVST
jgi:hypothetical protein